MNTVWLKMLCQYRLGKNCLHLTFKQYLSSETYSHKYGENARYTSMLNITETNDLLKMCGLKIRLCLFTFWSIASKQLDSLTTIVTLSWLGGKEVTRPLGFERSQVQFPTPAKVWIFVLLWFCFYVFVPKHIICHKNAISFAMLMYLVCLTYCKICDRL